MNFDRTSQSASQRKSGYGIFDDLVSALSDWTLEDAERATKEWRAGNGHHPSPLLQWAVWNRELPCLHKEWTDGRAPALMEAIDCCGRFRLPLPPWCSAAISNSVGKVQSFTARTWDDALGAAHKKGARLPNLRSEYKNKIPAVAQLLELLESENPITLDAAKEKVSKEYPISVDLLERWFYEFRDKFSVTEEVTTQGSIFHPTGKPISSEK